MASANIDLVRSIYSAWQGGDYSSADWAHPEIEFVVADGPDPSRGTGLAAMAKGARGVFEAWEEFRIEPEEYRELDDEHVLALDYFSARGKASGLELGQLQAKGANLFRIHGGEVTKIVRYFDRENALADLGLSERPRDNVEVAREVVEAVARQDVERLLELTDPEVEWHSVFAQLGEGGIYRGHDGIRRYVSDLSDAWEIMRAHIDDGISIGAVVLMVGNLHYRGRGSGVETKSPLGFVAKFDQEKVVFMRAFQEPEQALLALGRSEESRGR
jgi:ketosteroid isomerase-like protein